MKPILETFDLSDGRTMTVRPPDPEADLGALLRFFGDLPAEQRTYLRYDVTQEKTCRERLAQLDGKDHFRLVAEVGGKILADATLDREPYFWNRHVAQMRCVSTPEAVGFEVCKRLLHELVSIGHQAQIEILTTEVMPEQTDFIALLVEAGFVHEATRRRVAKDVNGGYHDLYIMANDLELVWQRLEQQLEDTDLRYRSGHE